LRFGSIAGWAAILPSETLKKEGFEAVFIGIGAHKSRELAIEGVQNDGVLRAIDFLLNVNLGYRTELGRKVVVVGGGNVAFDVARSVVRQAEKLAGMSEAELRSALQRAAAAMEQLTAETPEAPDELRLALDVAREAIRKGVPEVHMYCLESMDEIPAAHEEIEEAEKEGIRLQYPFRAKENHRSRRASHGHRAHQMQQGV
jgi:formate dehydrogenase beta subunit